MLVGAVVLGRAFLTRGVSNPLPFAGECHLLEVVDGQTLRVRPANAPDSSPVLIRLMAIAVPKSFDADAAAFLCSQLADGRLSLELDKRRIDSNGHLLAYAFVDKQFLNAGLVERGLARVNPYPGNSASMERELFRAQDSAVASRKGIWQSGGKPRSRPASALLSDDAGSAL